MNNKWGVEKICTPFINQHNWHIIKVEYVTLHSVF